MGTNREALCKTSRGKHHELHGYVAGRFMCLRRSDGVEEGVDPQNGKRAAGSLRERSLVQKLGALSCEWPIRYAREFG